MSTPGLKPQTFRTAIAATIIALAVHFTQSRDVLVDFTRPVVMTSLHWLGVDAVNRGEVIAVGQLHIPWTRDCAGINLLLILLALAVWVNRQERNAGLFWLRLVGMIPAALTANVLRVLTLIAYRTLAYPGVESPQTHYFIGFFWLVPFVALITPRDHRPKSFGLLETLHAAAVVSLLAPMSGTPNATLVSLAAVLLLSQCRVRGVDQRLMYAWLIGGAGIAFVSMESFWLPWLLACPMLISPRWILRVPWLICLACSNSLIAMQPWAWGLVACGLASGWLSRCELVAANQGNEFQGRPAAPPLTISICFLIALALPFLASTMLSLGQVHWTPPSDVAARPINQSGYEIRLNGQPQHIGLACYVAATRDRHHTVKVCLKYRGIDVTSVVDCPLVFTEGRHWYREFFIQNGQILPDYAAYVKSTFRPWSDPGVHLIFVSLCEKQSPSDFSIACERLAAQLHRHSNAHLTVASE